MCRGRAFGISDISGSTATWRRAETHKDLDSFFDRWQRVLGTALIEGPPPFDPTPQDPGDTLIRAVTPPRVARREARRRMTIYCDGSVPVSELSSRMVSTPRARSFSNWSRIRAIRGDTTTEIPGKSRLGSW